MGDRAKAEKSAALRHRALADLGRFVYPSLNLSPSRSVSNVER